MSLILNLNLSLSGNFTVNINVFALDVLNISNCSSSTCGHFVITSLNLDFLNEEIILPCLFENIHCINESTFSVFDSNLVQRYFANNEDLSTFDKQNLANSSKFLLQIKSKQDCTSKNSISINSQTQSLYSFNNSQSIKKRKRSLKTNRYVRTRVCSSIPKYEMKMSRIKFN